MNNGFTTTHPHLKSWLKLHLLVKIHVQSQIKIALEVGTINYSLILSIKDWSITSKTRVWVQIGFRRFGSDTDITLFTLTPPNLPLLSVPSSLGPYLELATISHCLPVPISPSQHPSFIETCKSIFPMLLLKSLTTNTNFSHFQYHDKK